ncbi:MAG: cobalamin biosynthesis protein CobD [Chloroflexota bacterium]|nr:MAG: cobalamin biosynthesis protein CobD [Chloroflexota bacterium]
MRVRERVATLVLAFAIDRYFGEPPAAVHPVVWIGRFARVQEGRAPGGRIAQLVYGACLTAAIVASAAFASALAERAVARLPEIVRVVCAALLLKPAFAVRGLFRAGEDVRTALEAHNLPAAREALRGLCSRDATTLGHEHIASGAIESIAENAVDSAVSPWLAYLIAGLPGAYAYRAANTLDAMIGYHGPYEYLGKIAARLDDLLNLVPARVTFVLIGLGAALGDGDPRRAFRIALRDHGATESPNAGWPMSAMAGALGIQLEKPGHYQLGDRSRPIRALDIAAAERIVGRGLAAALALLLLLGCVGRRNRVDAA